MIRTSPYVVLDNTTLRIQAPKVIIGQAFSVVPKDLHPIQLTEPGKNSPGVRSSV